MKRSLLFLILSCVVAIVFITPAFAADNFYSLSAGSNNWDSGNWSYTHAPYSGEYGQINNNPTAGTTNIVYRDGNWYFGSGGGLTVENTGAGGNNMMLVNSGHFETDHVNINSKGIATVLNGGSFTAWLDFNVTSGGTLDLNGGQMNYGGISVQNMNISGTLVGENSGTYNGLWNGTHDSIVINSGGKVIANSGTFWANTGSGGFGDGTHGLQINSGGQLIVNSGATFVLNRWDSNGWAANTPDNLSGGVIMLNGGTLAFNKDGSGIDATLLGYNAGSIQGNGELVSSWKMDSTGYVIASNGVLNVFKNGATFTSNGGSTLTFGHFTTVSGGQMVINDNVAFGVGGNWGVNSGGTLEVAAGKNVDLGVAYMPGANVQGTVKVNSGANLTLSANYFGSYGLQDVQGTFLLLNGTVYTPNDTVNVFTGEFTNSTTGIITGNGSLVTGFGAGGGNVNYAIINHGNIVATNGTLYVNPNDAFNNGGFQNASDGTVTIKNDGSLNIVRSQNEWNNHTSDSVPNNSGQVLMQGGYLSATSIGGASSSKSFSNAASGTIRGSGTIDSTWSTVKNAGTIFADSQTPLVVSSAFLVNQSGGIFTADTARVVVNAVFTNQSGGRFTSMNSVSTFNAPVINSGAWVTDPSTNIFNDTYTVTSSGFIAAAAGDVYIFSSNFVNQSTQNTSYDTFNTTPGGSGAAGTKFIFDGTNTVSSTGYTQQFFTAGLKLTGGFIGTPSITDTQQVSSFAAVTGFVDNFALDRLEIGNLGTNSIVELFDSFPGDGNTGAVFVSDLWLFGSSRLILSNNTVLYFVNSNTWSLANISLLGNAEIHQLVLGDVAAIPEPSILLLWGVGIATVIGARRRAKKRS